MNLTIGVNDLPLLDMLRYARGQTIAAVQGLTTAQLDHRHDDQSNSIGALLSHIVSVEAWYQTNTFESRDWTAEEEARWEGAIDLGDAQKAWRGHPLEYYLDLLADIRARTESELRRQTEDWLLRVEPFGNSEANNYWKWFHVCEDEINHRGQIRWLRKRLPA